MSYDRVNMDNVSMGYTEKPLVTTLSIISPENYAGFWLRVIAVILDGLILALPTYILNEVFRLSWFGTLLPYIYGAAMESSSKQATLGKMIVGIYVTDTEGNRLSFGRAFLRHLAMIVSAIILSIGFVMAGFTERKQALHDIMVDTLVLKKDWQW